MAYNAPINATTRGKTLGYSTKTETVQATSLASGDDCKTQQQMCLNPKPTTRDKNPPSSRSIELDRPHATRIEQTINQT